MNTAYSTPQARFPALALASLLTLAMLLGVNTLATADSGAAQLAQHSTQAPA